jgi:hypothetical protein
MKGTKRMSERESVKKERTRERERKRKRKREREREREKERVCTERGGCNTSCGCEDFSSCASVIPGGNILSLKYFFFTRMSTGLSKHRKLMISIGEGTEGTVSSDI